MTDEEERLIAALEAEIADLRNKLDASTRLCASIYDLLFAAEDARDGFEAATRSAARTAITALERIQELQVVVDAAIAWRAGSEFYSKKREVEQDLTRAVDAHLKQVATRS